MNPTSRALFNQLSLFFSRFPLAPQSFSLNAAFQIGVAGINDSFFILDIADSSLNAAFLFAAFSVSVYVRIAVKSSVIQNHTNAPGSTQKRRPGRRGRKSAAAAEVIDDYN